LAICLLMLEEPELLILDEPTNHLDLETKDIVEDVFESYEGPIIFISHDRYFINRVASKILHMDKTGSIVFDGNYDGFKDFLASRTESKASKPIREKNVNVSAEIRKFEQQIDAFHQRIKTLQDSLFEERVYGDRAEYDRVSREIADLEEKADSLFDKIANLSGD